MSASDPPPPASEKESPAAAGSDLSLIQRAIARVSGIPTDAALAQQVASLQMQVASLTADAATLTIERDDARADLAQHQSDLAALQTALDQPPAAQMQTPAGQQIAAAVAAQVGTHLRALSHPAANLPAAAGKPNAANDETVETIIEQMKAEKDPVKKGKLCDQLAAMREQIAKKSSN